MSSGVLSFYRSGETRRAAIGNVLFGEPSFVSVNVSLHKKELRTSVTYSRNSVDSNNILAMYRQELPYSIRDFQ